MGHPLGQQLHGPGPATHPVSVGDAELCFALDDDLDLVPRVAVGWWTVPVLTAVVGDLYLAVTDCPKKDLVRRVLDHLGVVAEQDRRFEA